MDRLAARVAARPGLRVPGAWDPLEEAVRALAGSRHELAGLVSRVGERVDGDGDGLTHLFPTRAALAGARGAIGALARSAVDFEVPIEEIVAALREVVPERAERIARQALGDPDAYATAHLLAR